MQLKPLSEQRRKEIATLGRKKGRKLHQQFLLEGRRAVKSARSVPDKLIEVILTQRVLDTEAGKKLVAQHTVPFRLISERGAKTLSDVTSNQGIFAVAWMHYASIETIQQAETIVVLDGVQDPGNVGTIIRTAAWFGIDAML